MKMTREDKQILEEALKFGQERDYHMRVHAVGHQGAGKTSLMRQLLLVDDIAITPTKSTDGIEINPGNCSIDIKTGDWYKDSVSGISLNVLLHSILLEIMIC